MATVRVTDAPLAAKVSLLVQRRRERVTQRRGRVQLDADHTRGEEQI